MTDYEPMFKEAFNAVFGNVPTAMVTDTRLSHDDYPKWDFKAGSYQCLCQQCNTLFPAKRRDAKYCNPNCRKTASHRKDQIERARRNIESQIMFIQRMVKDHPDLDIFASLELDKIRRLLNVTTAVETDSTE